MEELDANFTSLLKSKVFDVSHSVTESRQAAAQVYFHYLIYWFVSPGKSYSRSMLLAYN